MRVANRVVILSCLLLLAACGRHSSEGIFSGLPEHGEGVVDATIELDGGHDIDGFRDNSSDIGYQLMRSSSQEIIAKFEEQRPRIMASLTKIPTALAVLENIPGIKVPDVANMLRTSDNHAASLYLRQFSQEVAHLSLPPLLVPKNLVRSKRWAHSCPLNDSDEAPGAQEVLTWLKKVLPVDWNKANLADGNGCDENNVMTPEQLVAILRYADSLGPIFEGQDFAGLLSTTGGTGTMRSRLRNLRQEAHVFAKTGTLHSAVTLAGYLFVPIEGKAEEYIFAVMVETHAGKTVSQGRHQIDSLVRGWVHELPHHR